MIRYALLLLVALTMSYAAPASATDHPFITVASTTSTQDSGLFEFLLPKFTAATGIDVHVVAVGTGQALKIGERGDADVELVHAKAAELQFVAEGFGVDRHDVMYNDFVLIGPKSDPVGLAGTKNVVSALQRIARAKAPFLSRGDDSGTDKAEKQLWQQTGIDVKSVSGTWYRETGAGMGPTLNTAAAMDAYTIADRSTWLSFKNRQSLVILVEGDTRLFNQYGVMLVNPERHPSVKRDLGLAFVNWMISRSGQETIAAYKINGEQLFFPNASP